MSSPTTRAAVFGLAFHGAVSAGAVAVAAANHARVDGRFWVLSVPLVLIAGAAAYALVVGPYLSRRSSAGRSVVLVDCLIGMLAECAAVALFALLFGLSSGLGTLPQGGASGVLVTAANGAAFALLYAAANFMEQILVIGNAAGLAGWLILRRAPRSGQAPDRGAA
jgi:hypothetical protein